MRHTTAVLALLLGCATTTPPPPGQSLPVPGERPFLRLASRLVDEHLDRASDSADNQVIYLATRGPDEWGNDSFPVWHNPRTLKVIQATYGYQGICQRNEPSCFRHAAGYLIRFGLPTPLGRDSVALWVDMARYHPQGLSGLPGNLGIRPQPPGDRPAPCPWEVEGGRIILFGRFPPVWQRRPAPNPLGTAWLCQHAS